MLIQSGALARTILGRQAPVAGFRTSELPRKIMLSAKFLARGISSAIAVYPVERSWGLIAPWQRNEIIDCHQQLLAATHQVFAGFEQPAQDLRGVHHAGVKTQITSICDVVAEIALLTGQTPSPAVTSEQSALVCSKLLKCLAALEPLFKQAEDFELPGEIAMELNNGLNDLESYFG
ncbi:MAG: hypothetical protein NVSMB39_3460 [Candidatus Saccharimonadales bacterium]